MLSHDYHVHLYGCLTPDDLWMLGRDTYHLRRDRLEWYANEYEKACGRRPHYEAYWQAPDGLARLRQDYLFAQGGSFARFQAQFNLILALCPLNPHDFSVQEHIIRQVATHGVQYFEARTLIPVYFEQAQALAYLTGLCQLVAVLNAELGMETRLVFCLFRDNALARKHYGWLRAFCEATPTLGAVIAGIDFAYAEEDYPPATKQDFFRQALADDPQRRWQYLYHVGESFTTITQASAIRWVMQAWDLGVDRLGHATALGADPLNYIGRQVQESPAEHLAHLRWLTTQADALATHGYTLERGGLEQALAHALAGGQVPLITYDEAYASDVRRLQYAVASLLRSRDVVIESCPTSNRLIGQIVSDQAHPLRFFHQQNLKVVLGTDDPGIFGIDWRSEGAYAQRLQAQA